MILGEVNGVKISMSKYEKIIPVAVTFFCSLLFGYGVVIVTGNELATSKIIISFLLFFCFSEGIYYALNRKFLFFDQKYKKKGISLKDGLILILCILFTYAPICMKGFFFHDDYLNFVGVYGGQDFYKFTFSQGRQATGIFTDLMNYVTVENSWQLRIIAVIGVCVYSLILCQIILTLTDSKNKAILVSLVLVFITPVINVASYGSMFCYPLAFVFSTMGILHFYESVGVDRGINKLEHWCLGLISIIMSNFIYQTTATVAFLAILLLYLLGENDQKRYKTFPIKATIFFGGATGIYYILVRLLAIFNGIEVMSRAGIISSLDEVREKIIWFFSVFYEHVKQILVSFIGNSMVQSPWMHYILYFKNNVIEAVGVITILFFLIAGIIRVWKKYSWLGFFQVICLLPLSYYVFLLLKENSYTSYYAVGLCSVILFLAIYGGGLVKQILLSVVKEKREDIEALTNIVCIFLCFMVAWNANYYMRDFWTGYNSYGYMYLKQEIADNYNGEARIHVFGTLYPGQADVYASSAAAMACKELGIDTENIEFTSSSNSQYIVSLSAEVYSDVLKKISDEDREFFENVYTIDTAFSVCTLKTGEMTEDSYMKLEKILKETGIIPIDEDKDVLIVDIQGINKILLD